MEDISVKDDIKSKDSKKKDKKDEDDDDDDPDSKHKKHKIQGRKQRRQSKKFTSNLCTLIFKFLFVLTILEGYFILSYL